MNKDSNLFRFIKYFKPYTSRIIESGMLMFSASLLELPLFSLLFRGKTFIIITHRISSLEIADKIVILEKGRIINIGSPERILNEYRIASKGKEEKLFIH